MARARNIKPAIMANEELADLSPEHRLMFIYLWMLADREGRLEDRPKRIAAQAFPYDQISADAVLNDLVRAGFIKRYEACGVRVILVCNFLKHQSPHGTEKDSDLPVESGVYTRHKRKANGYATGNVELLESDGTGEEQPSNIDLTVKERPDIRIPDSGFSDSPIPETSVPKGTGGQAAKVTDPQEIIFGYGVPYLVNAGTPDKQARSFLGKLRKMHGDAEVIDKLRACMREKPLQPLEWLAAALPPHHAGGKKPNKQEALEASNRAVGDEWAAEMMSKMNGGFENACQ